MKWLMNIRLVGNAVTIMSNHLVILHEAREKKSSKQMFCLSYSPGADFIRSCNLLMLQTQAFMLLCRVHTRIIGRVVILVGYSIDMNFSPDERVWLLLVKELMWLMINMSIVKMKTIINNSSSSYQMTCTHNVKFTDRWMFCRLNG